MDITIGFLFLVAFCVWGGILLTNVRKIRKAAERTADATEHAATATDYQSQLAYRQATQVTRES